MIPAIGTDGWAFMRLRPTRYTPEALAKVKVEDGRIVQAFTREFSIFTHHEYRRRLHWVAGSGSWTEAA